MGNDDVYLDGIPANFDFTPQVSHYDPNLTVSQKSDDNIIADYCHITQLDNTVSIESKKEDNLLRNLQQYYEEVKTK